MKRFFDKVRKTNGCWIWTAAIRGKSGYGCIKFRGKTVDAHRVSWILHYGEIPEGKVICHKCDNRKCVNPDHLFLGTQSDNMKDAYSKGRLIIPDEGRFKDGNIPKNSKITTREEMVELKSRIKNRTCSLKELSILLDLPYQLLRDISCGRIYKNI